MLPRRHWSLRRGSDRLIRSVSIAGVVLSCTVVASGEAMSITFDRDVAIIPPGAFESCVQAALAGGSVHSNGLHNDAPGLGPAAHQGMLEKPIISHYENNYGGAVKRLNLLTEQLAGFDFNTASNFLINGLKREELITANSMILDELFSMLSAMRSIPGNDLTAARARDFGSIERWRAEFVAMGKALAGGSGWVLH